MPWAAIGAGVSIASGIGSFLANSSANDRAAAAQSDAMQKWLALNVPDPAQQKVVLDKFVNQGQLDPILQTAIKQDPSAFNQVIANQGDQAAQTRALKQLEDVGNSGGLRLQDKEALQEAQLSGQAQERGQRNSIQSQMAQRGLGGSGFDVAAQLQGQQGNADRSAQSSLKVAADAQNRALQSIEGAGNMATQMRTQDYGEQAQKANAADRINQFNTQNAQNVNAANVGMQNRDQQTNLQNQQDVANKNTDTANKQQMYNSGLVQQQYQNQVQKLQGATGQSNNIAKTDQAGGQITGNTISNIGGAVAGAANAQNNADFWDNYFKKKAAADPTSASGGTYSGGVNTGSFA